MNVRTEISQKAWKLREEGKILEALAIWQKLYYTYVEDKNWERAISTLIDITICWKIKGEISQERIYFETALATLHHIKYISEKENTPLRPDFDYHLAGIQTVLGVYEQAIASYEHYLSTSKTPEEEANVLAHAGYATALHGQKEEGIATLRKALEIFENSQKENEFQGKDVFRIWKLGTMLKLANVLDDKKEARELAEKAFKEAKEKGLGARRKQAKALLEKLQ
jgi:tetratricopeptide (TPR) repeat protein